MQRIGLGSVTETSAQSNTRYRSGNFAGRLRRRKGILSSRLDGGQPPLLGQVEILIANIVGMTSVSFRCQFVGL